METERRPAMGREVAALAALRIRVEDEAARVDALQEDDAGRRAPVLADRRQRHRIGVGWLRLPGLCEPGVELGKGLLELDLAHIATRPRKHRSKEPPGRHRRTIAPPQHLSTAVDI